MTTRQLIHMDGFATIRDLEEVGITLRDEEGFIQLTDGSMWQWRQEHGLYELLITTLT
jgi:hypothetical protein